MGSRAAWTSSLWLFPHWYLPAASRMQAEHTRPASEWGDACPGMASSVDSTPQRIEDQSSGSRAPLVTWSSVIPLCIRYVCFGVVLPTKRKLFVKS